MPTFDVYKGASADSNKIAKTQTTRELKDGEVLLRITASGVCGTDEHMLHSGCVLGHEGVGIIEELGKGVKNLKVGDRVGFGYQHGSCGDCEYCLTGRETYCENASMYGSQDLDQGSFSSHAIWPESWVFKIPDTISDSDAAPLMCGGATVFTPFSQYNIQPTARVGIIGVGGLGHLAIQFASKMGCDVVVFSSTDSKREETLRLGASEFVTTKGKSQLDIGQKLDALLVTTSAQPDWKLFVPVLAATATIFPLSVDFNDFRIGNMDLMLKGLRVQGSAIATRHTQRQMLQFASRHQVKPMTVKFPFNEQGIEDAMETLRQGRMRYRGVLVRSS